MVVTNCAPPCRRQRVSQWGILREDSECDAADKGETLPRPLPLPPPASPRLARALDGPGEPVAPEPRSSQPAKSQAYQLHRTNFSGHIQVPAATSRRHVHPHHPESAAHPPVRLQLQHRPELLQTHGGPPGPQVLRQAHRNAVRLPGHPAGQRGGAGPLQDEESGLGPGLQRGCRGGPQAAGRRRQRAPGLRRHLRQPAVGARRRRARAGRPEGVLAAGERRRRQQRLRHRRRAGGGDRQHEAAPRRPRAAPGGRGGRGSGVDRFAAPPPGGAEARARLVARGPRAGDRGAAQAGRLQQRLHLLDPDQEAGAAHHPGRGAGRDQPRPHQVDQGRAGVAARARERVRGRRHQPRPPDAQPAAGPRVRDGGDGGEVRSARAPRRAAPLAGGREQRADQRGGVILAAHQVQPREEDRHLLEWGTNKQPLELRYLNPGPQCGLGFGSGWSS